MARDNPRRITRRKLLKFTGQQADCKAIQFKLDRHDQVVAEWKKRGFHYDPETGQFQRDQK